MEGIYKICFYGGLVLAILLLIVSIVLFVVLKIPKVIGELTGSTARKSINEMKSGVHNSSESARKEQGKYYNQGSGKIKVRETVSEEKRKENRDDTTDLLVNKKKVLQFETVDVEQLSAATESIKEKKQDVPSPDIDEEETSVLTAGEDEEETMVLASEQDEEETMVLASEQGSEEETTVLAGGRDEEETTVLAGGQDEEGTTVLAGAASTDQLSQKANFQYNVVVTHTDESL